MRITGDSQSPCQNCDLQQNGPAEANPDQTPTQPGDSMAGKAITGDEFGFKGCVKEGR
jgi:hypothetical protein